MKIQKNKGPKLVFPSTTVYKNGTAKRKNKFKYLNKDENRQYSYKKKSSKFHLCVRHIDSPSKINKSKICTRN